MKIWQALALAGAVWLCAGAASADQGPYPETEEALQAEFEKLVWQHEPVTYQFAASHSSVTLPQGYALLLGQEARRFLFLGNGVEFPETEAVVADWDSGAIVSFEYVDSGYVTDDDWSELDPDELLQQIKDGTDAANEERKANNIPALHVKGWRELPRFDAETRTAYWSIELHDDETGPVINASVIRLSRHGYSRLIWAGDPAQFSGSGAMLDGLMKAHAYDPGFRYADYVDGDVVAGFGIASLVAVAAGGEKSKGIIAAIIAAALIFLKKGWIVILAVLGGGWAAVKKLFVRRKAAAATPVAAERSDATDGGGGSSTPLPPAP